MKKEKDECRSISEAEGMLDGWLVVYRIPILGTYGISRARGVRRRVDRWKYIVENGGIV